MKYNLITILGPTATGKTRLASLLANVFNGEIISADSRQVFKGMDIGTGKDLDDYIVDGKQIPYHLIDMVTPEEEFNLFLFTQNFYKVYNEIIKRDSMPFLVGGSGLYLSSVLQQYNLPAADFSHENYDKLSKLSIEELKDILVKSKSSLHNTTDLKDKERIIRAILVAGADKSKKNFPADINPLVLGILPERTEIKRRITERLKQRLGSGMVEEVKRLIEQGVSVERLKSFGLEYKFVGMYLNGELNYNDMYQKLNSAIHQFSKRQVTWFRKMEREGVKIYWLHKADFDTAKGFIQTSLENN